VRALVLRRQTARRQSQRKSDCAFKSEIFHNTHSEAKATTGSRRAALRAGK
jgi:hypothetical protein